MPAPAALVLSNGFCGVLSVAAVPADIDRLLREHNSALLRFVAAPLGSEQEAKEVSQEAYIRLLRLDYLEAITYLRAFLFNTTANQAGHGHGKDRSKDDRSRYKQRRAD